MRRRGTGFVRREIVEQDPRFAPFAERLDVLIGDLLEEYPFTGEMARALMFLVERPSGEKEAWMPFLSSALEALETWEAEALEGLLRAFMKGQGLKGRTFFHPLRLLLTGRERGAALPLVLFALGREEAAARLLD